MRRTWAIAAPLAVTLFAAACGGSDQGGQDGSGSDQSGQVLRGHTYVSQHIVTDGKPYALAPGSRLTLNFTDDGRLIADAGCNSAQGQVDLSAGRMAVEDPVMTGMGCDQALMDQDRWLARLLGAGPRWEFSDGTLYVATPEYRIELADEDSQHPDLALIGTTWTLNSTVADGTAEHSGVMRTVTMTFTETRASGVSACRTFGADIELDGPTVTFAGLDRGTPGIRACSDAEMAIEQRVLGALTGSVTATIHQDRLTLGTESGADLVWTGTR